MSRNRKVYKPSVVWDYIAGLCEEGEAIDTIEGVLTDSYIVYHSPEFIEVWEEVALNEWSSGYHRHVYRKGLPRKWVEAIEEYFLEKEREEEENARSEIIQGGAVWW